MPGSTQMSEDQDIYTLPNNPSEGDEITITYTGNGTGIIRMDLNQTLQSHFEYENAIEGEFRIVKDLKKLGHSNE